MARWDHVRGVAVLGETTVALVLAFNGDPWWLLGLVGGTYLAVPASWWYLMCERRRGGLPVFSFSQMMTTGMSRPSDTGGPPAGGGERS
jgi:hypothetical protein